MEFTYNASALAAGGVFRNRGISTIVPSLASVALAPTGGEGKSVVSNYFSEELSFAHAETRVSGRRTGPGIFTTFTYVFIKDLRVFDKLAIGELRGTVTSIHSERDTDDDHDFQLEASYRDVRAAGHDVVPAIDLCVGSLKRYRHLRDVLSAGANGRTGLASGLVAPTDAQALAERFNASSPEELDRLVVERRALHGSLVERVDGQVSRRHHKVYVEGLGTVRFGELMLKPGRRRVNLLRVSFGTDETQRGSNDDETLERIAADEGTMTIASVEGNGMPVYP
jgi:hypothetical protein